MLGPQQPQSRAKQGEYPSWTKVERKKKINPQVIKTRRKRVGVKRENGDAVVIKTKQSKYSDVLNVMRSDAKLVDLGADVRSITRIRTGEMFLKVKCDDKEQGRRLQKFGGRGPW